MRLDPPPDPTTPPPDGGLADRAAISLFAAVLAATTELATLFWAALSGAFDRG